MSKIEITIDDGILSEAKQVLQSIGMDVEMAVSVYLRRIAMERGLPMSMTSSLTKRFESEASGIFERVTDDDAPFSARSNTKITAEMVDAVWLAFLKHLKGSEDMKALSAEVSLKSGMNRGSAFIYLIILANLVNGDPNTRVLKFNDLEYFMGKIKDELGENKYQKALQSLISSIPYWQEKIPGAFTEKIEAYCRKHSKG